MGNVGYLNGKFLYVDKFGVCYLECILCYVCYWIILLFDLNLLFFGCGLRGYCIERNKESMCDNLKNY